MSESSGFTGPSVEDIQTLLPQYEILEQIGSGGMGAVYKARQPDLDRIIAIKILPSSKDDEFNFKERFRREAKAMARLQHPGIIAVFEFGETESNDNNPLLYIVMEYVEGADLNYLIKSSALDLSQVLVVVAQICDALQYAHEQNIIHRDIKPANIMLNMSGDVKIADFGLAKIISTETSPEPDLTRSNMVMGTLDYLAPEQMETGATVDQRADLYALGVLIYEMLTGKAPRGAFVLPSEKLEDLDPRVDHLIIRAMATDPSDRFQSADELSTAILNIGTPEPEPEPEPEPVSKSTSQATSITPWESTTAKLRPVPDELKPATQADLEAAVKAATQEATRIATHAALKRAKQRDSSLFLSNIYSAAKTLMVVGVIFLLVIVLGLITWAKWPQISKALTRSKPTPNQQVPQKQTIPPYTSSIPQQTKTTPSKATPRKIVPPPHPPPGFPPPRGGKRPPPPRKR